ncbi:hevamine-A-like protein [Tanacetum coccineum]
MINLSGHYDPYSNGCTNLTTNIISCRAKAIKVMLTIGVALGSYCLTAVADAKQIATYHWNKLLGGSSSTRPLGDTVLNVIEFDNEGGTTEHWCDLAKYLSGYTSEGKKVYLTAAPQCPFLDAYIGTSL